MTDMRPRQHPSGKAPVRLGLGSLTLALLAAGGCVKKTSDVPKPDFNSTMAKMDADPDVRLRELQRLSADYAALVHSLPGSTPREDQDKIRRAFSTLTQLLPLVQVGPHGGVFDHQVSVVADTRTLLAGGSTDLSATPIIDRGLRAVYNALDDAQHNSSVYYEDAELRATLDKLSAKLNEFDTARGALHDIAWADAFNLTSDATARMTTILAEKLAPGATTGPATAPAGLGAAPTTAPADSGTTPTPAAPTTAPMEPATTPPAAPATAPMEPGTTPPAAPATAPSEPATAPTTAPSP